MPDDQQPATPPPGFQPPPGPPPSPGAAAVPTYPGTGYDAHPAYAPAVAAPRGLGIAAMVLAVALALAQVAAWAASWSASARFQEMARTGTDVLAGPVLAYDLIALVYVPTTIATYVVSCVWLYRCRTNIEGSAAPWPQKRGRVWVWLGWWVPIVSLWFPYQVVRDVRSGTLRDYSSGGLGLWWMAWLVYVVTSRSADRLVPISGVPDAGPAASLPWFHTVSTVAVLVALVLWLRVIRQVTEGQAKLAPRA